MAKISVIIPVYGVEKYLNRCVESVVNQTFQDLEIILVDDGSPDNCPQMCDEWASRDTRIRTVHRENGGLSCARNTGLSIASGEYVTFIDSDDWIAADTYEYCINFFNRYEDTDAIQFDYIYVYPDKKPSIDRKEIIESYTGKEILENYLESSTRTGSYSVCRCLFKANIAQRYRFREGKINEDIDYKYKVLRDCNRLIVSNQIKYFYWQEGNSTSSGKLKKRDFQLYEAAEELYSLTKDETYGKIAYYGKLKKARTPFSLLTRILIWGSTLSSNEETECIIQQQRELRESLFTLLSSPISLSRKVLAIMMAINFKTTRNIYHILRKVRPIS